MLCYHVCRICLFIHSTAADVALFTTYTRVSVHNAGMDAVLLESRESVILSGLYSAHPTMVLRRLRDLSRYQLARHASRIAPNRPETFPPAPAPAPALRNSSSRWTTMLLTWRPPST